MSKPFFNFSPSENWFSRPSIQTLSLEEKGAYIHLLCYMWENAKNGDYSLKEDEIRIHRLLGITEAKWKKLKEILVYGPMPVFREENGRLYLCDEKLEKQFLRAQPKKKNESSSLQAESVSISSITPNF